MYRLKFRKSGVGIFALIIGAVLVVSIPFISVAQGLMYDLPAAWIAPAQLVIPLLFAFYTYRACPFIQQMRAFLVTCSIIGFFGILANKGCPDLYAFQVIQQDWLLHFNAATIGVMNLGGLIAATNLMQAEQMSSFADSKVAEAQLERLKAVKVDPDTQAKWEKAAAYADRSADGRSLRSTMTNLKAISLTEPGQELKPTMRDSQDKDRSAAGKDKGSSTLTGDDGSLANMLDRMDDIPIGEGDAQLSAIRRDPALVGNSFINDVTDSEPVDTGASFLDSLLNAKIQEGEDEALASSDLADMGLPAEEAETVDVAALLDSFPDEATESDAAPPEAEAEPLAALSEQKSWLSEEKFEARPVTTKQIDQSAAGEAPETTRTSSFANASSSRNSLPAMQPLHEGAAPEISALSSDDTSNFPVPNATPQTLSPSSPSASPSNTNNKLAAMKRRNTSTFTKLNALSASGTGTLKPPEPDTEAQPDSLRNLLDRLDDDKVEEPVQKVPETPKPLEPPVELSIETVFKEDGTPEVAATPKARPPVKAAVPEATVKAVEPEVPAKVVEPEAPAKSGEPEAPAKAVEPEAPAKAVEPEAPAKALEEEPPAPSIIEAIPETATIETEPEPEAAPLASLLDRTLGEIEYEYAEAPSTFTGTVVDEEEVEEVREAVFGTGVDSDIDNIFSELAPPEAQLEVSHTEATAKKAPSVNSLDEAPDLSPGAGDLLFGGSAYGEIDHMFSALAPSGGKTEVSGVLPGASTARGATPTSELSLSAIASEEAIDEEASEAPSSLFGGGLDSEIDDIFSELAPPEAQKEVRDMAPSSFLKEPVREPVKEAAKETNKEQIREPIAEPVKATAKVEEAPEVAAELSAEAEGEAEESAEGGLFGEDLGQELDNIFSGLTEGPQLEVNPSTLARYKGDDLDAVYKSPAPKSEPTPAAAKAPAASPDKAVAAEAGTAAPAKPEAPKYKEVKEFGRLSSKAGTAAKFGNDTGGTMKTIGKLLLDVQAVENIIKSGETKKIGSGLSTAKIISAARGEGIKNILNSIDTYEGVAGSLIVGHDGLVIASTVGTGWDKDMLGALSTALLSTSNLATKKLEIGKLRQMVMLTELANGDGQQFKTTVLTDVDVGILAVFMEKTDLKKIDGLLDTIQTTIHGG